MKFSVQPLFIYQFFVHYFFLTIRAYRPAWAYELSTKWTNESHVLKKWGKNSNTGSQKCTLLPLIIYTELFIIPFLLEKKTACSLSTSIFFFFFIYLAEEKMQEKGGCLKNKHLFLSMVWFTKLFCYRFSKSPKLSAVSDFWYDALQTP